MAYVDWSAGIDSVSGALAKPGKSGQHSCDKMLLGTHRVAATLSNHCNRLYMRKKTRRRYLRSSRCTTKRPRQDFAGQYQLQGTEGRRQWVQNHAILPLPLGEGRLGAG